jgi:hypothetical protein
MHLPDNRRQIQDLRGMPKNPARAASKVSEISGARDGTKGTEAN